MSDEPLSVELETPDVAAENRAKLGDLFPGVIADGVLDADRLGTLLDIGVTAPLNGPERFGLMWAGKQDAIRSLLTPSRGALLPAVEDSIEFDTARNVFIEGDNLEVLKLLQKAYNDQVDLIYIDPPYNTGNDFVYDDDFTDGLGAYLEYTGQVDQLGNRVRATVDTTGRRHSRWLSMLYPRLVLARNLLTQGGVLAVSIDDNEVANLRGVLDEVFGQENFLNTFVWVSNLKGRQISGSGAAATKEYLHVYARNVEEAGTFRASVKVLKALMPSIYKGLDYEVLEDERGPYVLKNQLYNTNSKFNEQTRPNLVYDIYFDPAARDVKTADLSDDHVYAGYVKIAPKVNNNGTHKYHAYRWSRAKVEAETHDLEFVETASGYQVFTKVRDVDSTALKDIVIGLSTSNGAADLKAVGIDPAWFDYPKPAGLIQLLVAACTDSDALVLDFFAGSGTTAHAVALQNAADGGRRRTISVNLPEPTAANSEARRAGLLRVSDITRARLLAVASRVEGAGDLGLRAFQLAESNFDDPKRQALGHLEFRERTLSGEEPQFEAIASEILLKEGIALDTPWTRAMVGGAPAVVAGGVAVVLSLDLTTAAATEALALGARVVVFLEDGFAGADAVKANAVTNAKTIGITLKTV